MGNKIESILIGALVTVLILFVLSFVIKPNSDGVVDSNVTNIGSVTRIVDSEAGIVCYSNTNGLWCTSIENTLLEKE